MMNVYQNMIDILASVWSVVQLAAGYESTELDPLSTAPLTLGGISVLLLLNLACHHVDDERRNPFSESLSAFYNAQGCCHYISIIISNDRSVIVESNNTNINI
jgi:hypothetical protein